MLERLATDYHALATCTCMCTYIAMELSISDLGSVLTAVFKASTKWYNIGLVLNLAVVTLERIGSQFDDPTDRLRETLKVWLETAAKPAWRDVVEALRSHVVGHSKLACDIETTRQLRMERQVD